jgi:hypothetical protein
METMAGSSQSSFSDLQSTCNELPCKMPSIPTELERACWPWIVNKLWNGGALNLEKVVVEPEHWVDPILIERCSFT